MAMVGKITVKLETIIRLLNTADLKRILRSRHALLTRQHRTHAYAELLRRRQAR